MAKRLKHLQTTFAVFLFGMFGIVHAQQTISNSKPYLARRLTADLFNNKFIASAGAMAAESLIEAEISRLFEQSDIDQFKFTHIIKGLQRGDQEAVIQASFLYEQLDLVSKNILSLSMSQYFFMRADYARAIEQLQKTDARYFSNDVNELVQFQLGVCFFSMKQFALAKPFFQSLIQIQQSGYLNAARYYLGFMSLSDRSYEDALQQFSQIVNDSHYKKVVPFYLAYIHYLNGQVDQAVLLAEQYIADTMALHLAEAMQLLANIHFNRGQYDRSVALYHKLINSGLALDRMQRYELGVGYYYANNYTQCISELKPLTSGTDSISGQSVFFLANAFLKTSDLKQARNAFSLCLSMPLASDRVAYSLFNYARLCLELGFREEGFRKMNEFIQLYPQSEFSANAREVLIEYFSKTNEFKQAISMLEKYPSNEMVSSPFVQRIYFGRSLELINEYDHVSALKYLDELVRNRPSRFYYPALFWQGEIYHRQGNSEKAIESFSTYLKGNSPSMGQANRANALYSLATVHYEMNSYSIALGLFEKLSADKTTNEVNIRTQSILKAADCAMMLNDISKARVLYGQSLKAGYSVYAAYQLAIIAGIENPFEKIRLLNVIEKGYPTSEFLPSIIMEIADTYISEEKFEMAIPYLERLLDRGQDKSPYQTQALLKLGVAYYNLDRSDDAIIQFRRLLKDYPSSPEAKDAIESAKAIFIENGKMELFSEFLQLAGIQLDLMQKDSLSFKFVQKRMIEGESSSGLLATDSYLKEFPTGMFVADVLNYRAQLLQQDKKWQELAVVLDKLLDQKGSRFRENALRLAAAVQFYELKNYRSAKGYYEALLRQPISSEIRNESLRGIVKCCYHLKDWDDGSSFAQDLLKTDSSPADLAYAYMLLGYLEQSNLLFELSSEYFNRVMLSGNSILAPEAAFQYSFNYSKLHDAIQAEKAIVVVIEKYGSDEYWNTKCYILLGEIFITQKDYFNARATLQSVLENTSNQELKAEVSLRLKQLSLLEKNNDLK